MKPTYLLDANVFIQAKNLYYSFDFCPAFWDWLDKANADGTVFSIERVQDEIVAGDDQLSEWVRQRPNLFLKPDDSVVDSLRAVSTWATESPELNYVLDVFSLSASVLILLLIQWWYWRICISPESPG